MTNSSPRKFFFLDPCECRKKVFIVKRKCWNVIINEQQVQKQKIIYIFILLWVSVWVCLIQFLLLTVTIIVIICTLFGFCTRATSCTHWEHLQIHIQPVRFSINGIFSIINIIKQWFGLISVYFLKCVYVCYVIRSSLTWMCQCQSISMPFFRCCSCSLFLSYSVYLSEFNSIFRFSCCCAMFISFFVRFWFSYFTMVLLLHCLFWCMKFNDKVRQFNKIKYNNYF